jgi:hypothetical protein
MTEQNLAKTADDPLKQLWKVKDQTAQQFGSAAAYFDYLKQQSMVKPVKDVAAQHKRSSQKSAGTSRVRAG